MKCSHYEHSNRAITSEVQLEVHTGNGKSREGGVGPRRVIRFELHVFTQREAREKLSGPKKHLRYPHFAKMAKERPIKLAAGGFHLGESHNEHRAILPRPSSRDFVDKTGVPPRPA